MNALDHLFAQLDALLPTAIVEELRATYRADVAADSHASRNRVHERQEDAHVAREQQAARDRAINTYRHTDGEGRRALRSAWAAWPALVVAFDVIERDEAQEW